MAYPDPQPIPADEFGMYQRRTFIVAQEALDERNAASVEIRNPSVRSMKCENLISQYSSGSMPDAVAKMNQNDTQADEAKIERNRQPSIITMPYPSKPRVPCPEEKCPISFGRRADANRHYKECHEPINFCDYSYCSWLGSRRKSTYQNHMKKFHGAAQGMIEFSPNSFICSVLPKLT